MQQRSFWFAGAIAGIACLFCYLAAILVDWPDTQLGNALGVVVASGFPILGIVFYYTLYEVVGAQAQGAANRLGLLFMALAFTTVLAMVLVQSAVVAGLPQIVAGLPEESARALRRGLRLVDMGLDVAWDFLFASGMICIGLAMRRHSAFHRFWAPAFILLAGAAIVLNAATFPWPPAGHGLFDIGPVIALFMGALCVRVALLARRAPADTNVTPEVPAHR